MHFKLSAKTDIALLASHYFDIRNTVEKKMKGNSLRQCILFPASEKKRLYSCIRNMFLCLKLFAARMLIFITQILFSSILIALVRKNKKWKHFVQLSPGKPVSSPQKKNNEMVQIIYNLMSIRLSSVGFAGNGPGICTLPSGGFLEGFEPQGSESELGQTQGA